MNKISLLPLLALGLLATGYSKENPFGTEDAGEGSFLKSAISVEIKADALQRQNMRTKAPDANPDDFTILFMRDGSAAPVAKYTYGEMPEVVTLPEGSYSVTATYGENREAEWESPYFLGNSEKFDVRAYEITSYVNPIECKLENIKVTVDFDPMLRAAMSDDSHVEVKVGSGASLHFTKDEADAEKGGFFLHSGETTLVATFNGKINGAQTSETKSLKNVVKGNHYKITFKLHDAGGPSTSGDLEGDINVDATVTVVDVTRDVEVGDEPLLPQDERPSEGPDTPDTPDDPVVNTPPEISAKAPLDLDAVNDAYEYGEDLNPVEINIHSSSPSGITEFICDIESPTLTAEALSQVGLASHLDLAHTPENLVPVLEGLGFPINVAGSKDVKFVITSFIPMLSGLGSGEHHFKLTVSDEFGTTVKVLKFKS